MTGLVRDRYEPVGRAGAGGQGEVLRAIDRMHGRAVALKARDAGEDRERLLAEARVLLGLTPHAGLPLVREDFFEDGRYWLVSDWIEGRTLAEIAAERPGGVLGLDETVAALRDVAAALDHMHAHDPPAIHRDVKPSNIIVTPGGRAVLVDLGIAARGGNGDRAGSRGTIAPEVAAGSAATPAADVFGLAATACILLDGAPPRAGRAPSLPGLGEAERTRTMRALSAGLALDPARRPATASAFVAMLAGEGTIMLPKAAEPVGRDGDIALVSAMLAERRLLTLTGTGGVGKTTLAVAAARLAAERAGAVARFAGLAALGDPAGVAATVAAALGVAEAPGVETAAAIEEAIGSGATVLVLDNCEHVLDGAAALAERLLAACPGLRILATSREPLGAAGESTWRVPSLPVAEDDPESVAAAGPAVALFCERARQANPAFSPAGGDAAALARICRRLDGIPLAIELAAARTRSLSIAEIDERLDDRFRLLTGGRRTAMPRQRTLRALIDWSFELLDDEERAAFARAAVFSGGFTLTAAEHVLGANGIERGDVAELLARLADRSMLLRDGDRFRMLESMRQYAEDRLRERDDAEAVRDRHLDWVAGRVAAAEPMLTGAGQAAALAELDAEQENVTAALSWAAAARPGDLARIAPALWRYWTIRGHLRAGRAWAEAALDAAAGAPWLGKAARVAGIMAQECGDYEGARARYEQSLAAARETGDVAGAADSLHNLGTLAEIGGDLATARERYAEALAMRREAGDEAGIADSLTNLCVLAIASGDYDAARSIGEECAVLFARRGDRRGAADAANNLGVVAEATGNAAEAAARYEEALAIRREIGDRWGVANALANLAALRTEEDVAGSRAALEEAVAIQRDIGDVDGLAWSLCALARADAAAGADARARAAVAESEVTRRQLGDVAGLAECAEVRAEIALAAGDLAAASIALDEAAALHASSAVARAPSDLARWERLVARVAAATRR